MAVAFDQIPSTIRIPGVYIELASGQSGGAEIAFRSLIIGQRLASGAAAVGVPRLVASVGDARREFGAGSMVEQMVAAFRRNNTLGELWAVGIDDAAGSRADRDHADGRWGRDGCRYHRALRGRPADRDRHLRRDHDRGYRCRDQRGAHLARDRASGHVRGGRLGRHSHGPQRWRRDRSRRAGQLRRGRCVSARRRHRHRDQYRGRDRSGRCRRARRSHRGEVRRHRRIRTTRTRRWTPWRRTSIRAGVRCCRSMGSRSRAFAGPRRPRPPTATGAIRRTRL